MNTKEKEGSAVETTTTHTEAAQARLQELRLMRTRIPRFAHLKPYAADMRRALGRVRKPSDEVLARRAAKKAPKQAATATPDQPLTLEVQ